MSGKKWVTGEELLARWDMQPFELVATMLSKELVPVDPETGRHGYERCDDGGVCFYCDKERVDRFTVCSDGGEYDPSASAPLLPVSPGSIAPDPLIVRCRFERHERETYRAKMAITSTFRMADVVAIEALATALEPGKKSGDDLGTRSRRTHQIIIAALCKKAKIDPASPHATTWIVTATDSIGAPVCDDVVRGILKELPDSLEAKKK